MFFDHTPYVGTYGNSHLPRHVYCTCRVDKIIVRAECRTRVICENHSMKKKKKNTILHGDDSVRGTPAARGPVNV